MKQYDDIVFSGDVRDYYERYQKTFRDVKYIKKVLEPGLIQSGGEPLFEEINRKLFEEFSEIANDFNTMIKWYGSYIEDMSLLNGGFVDSTNKSDNVYFNDAKQMLENDFDEMN